MARVTTPPQNYVRPDELQPNGPNPFDNGTAEPSPPLGDPNGVSLEHVTSITPPAVYEAAPVVAPNGVTAKASAAERDEHDAMVIASDEEFAEKLRQAQALSLPGTADAVTAKASPEERAAYDAGPPAADAAPAAEPTA